MKRVALVGLLTMGWASAASAFPQAGAPATATGSTSHFKSAFDSQKSAFGQGQAPAAAPAASAPTGNAPQGGATNAVQAPITSQAPGAPQAPQATATAPAAPVPAQINPEDPASVAAAQAALGPPPADPTEWRNTDAGRRRMAAAVALPPGVTSGDPAKDREIVEKVRAAIASGNVPMKH